MATLPPASRSPMMPEPTTAANNSAVPVASLAARRLSVRAGSAATAVRVATGHGVRLARANEGAGETAVHLWREMMHVKTRLGEKRARVFHPIDRKSTRLNSS